MPAKTFILVHGAWHGGWGWVRVADRLRTHGHRIFAPTLTGLGERAHLLHPGINLSLHIADVIGLIKYERLGEFVLVGHSYGGSVISGVAEAVPDAIRSIVFLDAFIPDNGDATLDLVQPAVHEIIQAALERGETTIPVRDAAAFRVNEADRAWVEFARRPTADRHHDREDQAHRRAGAHTEEDLYSRLGLPERLVRESSRARQGRPGLAHL